MNPYPLSALNHFTVPVAINETPPLLTSGTGRGGARRASGTRSNSRPRLAAIRPRRRAATPLPLCLLGLPLLFQRLLSRLLLHALLRVLVLARHALTSLGASGASAASGLCRTHRRTSILVDFNHVASGVCAAGEALQTLGSLRDDRVGL